MSKQKTTPGLNRLQSVLSRSVIDAPSPAAAEHGLGGAGFGRGGAEMNKGRSDRLVLHIDPGTEHYRTMDVTDLQAAFKAKLAANVPKPRSEDEIAAAFDSLDVAPRNGAVRLGSYAIQPPAPLQVTPMDQRAMPGPTPMGQPFGSPPDQASPFVKPQITRPEFAPAAMEPVPHPTQSVYWDLPGLENTPDSYHDMIYDGQGQLVFVRDARYRPATQPPALPPPGAPCAFNLAGTNEVFVGEFAGNVFQHGHMLYRTMNIAQVVPLTQYLHWKIQASTPPSPFAGGAPQTPAARSFSQPAPEPPAIPPSGFLPGVSEMAAVRMPQPQFTGASAPVAPSSFPQPASNGHASQYTEPPSPESSEYDGLGDALEDALNELRGQ